MFSIKKLFILMLYLFSLFNISVADKSINRHNNEINFSHSIKANIKHGKYT